MIMFPLVWSKERIPLTFWKHMVQTRIHFWWPFAVTRTTPHPCGLRSMHSFPECLKKPMKQALVSTWKKYFHLFFSVSCYTIKLYFPLFLTEMIIRKNESGLTALDYATMTNNARIATFLVNVYFIFGQDIFCSDSQGNTLLHMMARKGDVVAPTLSTLLTLRYR